ncbi:hypothetical protein [Saccharopolyspora sp. NPDC050642]|uniref:hypothetical protein n=1 Tax=Saccharopolyspora sp. NPDC050642 TaxID=3157099 RepID=UPI0033C8739B
MDPNRTTSWRAPAAAAVRTAGMLITGSMPGCEGRRSPADFDRPGARYDSCRLDAAGEGDEVENPIVWRLPGR